MTAKDIKILRDLAKRVKEAGEDPLQEKRREQCRGHNALIPGNPLIYIFPEGAWEELVPQSSLKCENPKAVGIETSLHQVLYNYKVIHDDQPIETSWIVPKKFESSGWGIKERRISSTESRGAWHFDPVIKEPGDLDRIKTPRITYNEEETERNRAAMEDIFNGILPVRVKGIRHIGYHLMSQYTLWRGLEEMMTDMYLNPGMLHEAMTRLTEGHKEILLQYRKQNLLELNNDGTYHSSGGNGYLENELPSQGFSGTASPEDMWASAESQELAQVGPEQHAEFALKYEKKLLEPFGLTGYGCCEDLTQKLDDVCQIPNLRRISISPWANVEQCAEKLKGAYIFSWKPQPAHLVGDFQPEMVREYLRNGIEKTLKQGCILEIILKDTHTCQNHPERFTQWLKIAREEVARGVERY